MIALPQLDLWPSACVLGRHEASPSCRWCACRDGGGAAHHRRQRRESQKKRQTDELRVGVKNQCDTPSVHCTSTKVKPPVNYSTFSPLTRALGGDPSHKCYNSACLSGATTISRWLCPCRSGCLATMCKAHMWFRLSMAAGQDEIARLNLLQVRRA